MITYIHRWFSKPLARHLREPDGLFGRLTARMMNATNAIMTTTAIDALDISPNHLILDVGFGGGDSLDQCLSRAPDGHISGTEISASMLRRAGKIYRRFISHGRLSLHEGTIEALPFGDNQFDRISTLNTIYFWSDPKQGVGEMYRVCKPNGKTIIAFRPRHVMQQMKFSQHGFTLFQSDEVMHLLREAGFIDITEHYYETDNLGFICLSASKGGETPPQ